MIIVLRAPTTMDAYKMFETLNDRGLPTTQADMLKNYLFGEAGDGGADEAQHKWSAMRTSLEPLGQDDITLTYLRHLTLTKYGPSDQKPNFYARLQEKIKGRSTALSFLDELSQYADDYAAILTPTHSKWNPYPNQAVSLLNTMRYLGVVQIRPLLLAVAHHFEPTEAERAFKAFVSWTVRFLIVGGMRGQRLEDSYAEHAHEVSTGRIETTVQLRNSMTQKSVLPTDTVFQNKFTEATVSKQHLARYYLRALEACHVDETAYPETAPIEDPTILNLEHIIPINGRACHWSVMVSRKTFHEYPASANTTVGVKSCHT